MITLFLDSFGLPQHLARNLITHDSFVGASRSTVLLDPVPPQLFPWIICTFPDVSILQSACGYLDGVISNASSYPSQQAASPAKSGPLQSASGSVNAHEDARMKLYFAGQEQSMQPQQDTQQSPQSGETQTPVQSTSTCALHSVHAHECVNIELCSAG